MLWDAVKTFLVSMLPIVELRGAIPVGTAYNLPWWLNYIVSVTGNPLFCFLWKKFCTL